MLTRPKAQNAFGHHRSIPGTADSAAGVFTRKRGFDILSHRLTSIVVGRIADRDLFCWGRVAPAAAIAWHWQMQWSLQGKNVKWDFSHLCFSLYDKTSTKVFRNVKKCLCWDIHTSYTEVLGGNTFLSSVDFLHGPYEQPRRHASSKKGLVRCHADLHFYLRWVVGCVWGSFLFPNQSRRCLMTSLLLPAKVTYF